MTLPRTGELHRQIVAAGVPIFGVARLSVAPGYRIDYNGATPAQQTTAESIAAGFDWTSRRPRLLFNIRADIVALTTAQKNAIWTDLSSGTPPKWALDPGPNAAALAVLQFCATTGTLSAADITEAKVRAAAMYAQDNPRYLVSPSFDATINVAGDEPDV